MKPRILRATAQTPDGGELKLYQHDHDFSIMINGQELMHSRRHESELELARLGCAHLINHQTPRVLIGGLGMGYTLRQTLDMLDHRAQVVVGELVESVVKWNHDFLGNLNDRPLEDERVEVKTDDIVEILTRSKNSFDAILLDVDNGPEAMTDSGNHRLYGYEGIYACRNALRPNGCLAVWSAAPSKRFEQLLMSCGFQVRRFRVPAHRGKKSHSYFIWVVSQNKKILPPGGGEPRLPLKKKSRGGRRSNIRSQGKR